MTCLEVCYLEDPSKHMRVQAKSISGNPPGVLVERMRMQIFHSLMYCTQATRLQSIGHAEKWSYQPYPSSAVQTWVGIHGWEESNL